MRRLAVLIILVVLLGGAGYGAYRWWHPADAVVIRRVLREAAAAASWEGSEGTLGRLAAAGRVANFCTEDVEILLDTAGARRGRVVGREAVRQAAAGARMQVAWLRLELGDIEISVVEPGKKAIVLLAAQVTIEGVGDSVVQDYEVAMRREADNGWLIMRVEPVKGFGM